MLRRPDIQQKCSQLVSSSILVEYVEQWQSYVTGWQFYVQCWQLLIPIILLFCIPHFIAFQVIHQIRDRRTDTSVIKGKKATTTTISLLASYEDYEES